jgi:hypothetical protein
MPISSSERRASIGGWLFMRWAYRLGSGIIGSIISGVIEH